MIDKIVDILINSFDYGYMLSVNVLTYLIIKVVDYFNGGKIVPVYAKRLIAVISGIILGVIIILSNGYSNTLLYSFILSLVSWDVIFKPIIKKIKGANYKK